MSILPTASSEVQSDDWKYCGLGGRLIPVAIGLCLVALRQLFALFSGQVTFMPPVLMSPGGHY